MKSAEISGLDDADVQPGGSTAAEYCRHKIHLRRTRSDAGCRHSGRNHADKDNTDSIELLK